MSFLSCLAKMVYAAHTQNFPKSLGGKRFLTQGGKKC